MSKEICLTNLLLNYGNANASKISIIQNQKALTYTELIEKSKALANYLYYIGAPNKQCIGIYLESSLELMIGVWGVLFSNNAYLPLATEYPEARIKYMIQDSNTKYIITKESLKSDLQNLTSKNITIVTLEEIEIHTKKKLSEFTFLNQTQPENLAYVIYTSGSTGAPKGVMIQHKAIVNQMQWIKEAYALENKIILQKTPISFDAAQWEILAIACGCTVVIGEEGIHRDPERIIDKIKTHKVTTLQCVPTLLRALLHYDEFKECTSLTQIFSGGEALSKKLALQFMDTFPICDLVNLYGPTECTINASSYKVSPAIKNESFHTIPIGTPVANTKFYILNENKERIFNNEIGELYIEGIQLAKGYFNKPEETTEKFIANPFSENKQSKLYKTGDRAFWNKDGTVQFIGRVDNQIKLRGYRIELDEIRTVIEKHSWVKNALVTVKKNPTTRIKNLMAFIELDANEAALMDQGNHGNHHQSKKNKLQIKAQLSNLGCRPYEENEEKNIKLFFKDASVEQKRFTFSRKTYRFYNGGDVSKQQVINLLKTPQKEQKIKSLASLQFNELSSFLRYFGQFKSKERLLPKYSYASPGALYATQMYLEIHNICGLSCGIYYYHPIHHELIQIRKIQPKNYAQIQIHFLGKKSAIEPVYKNNIQEVLEIEVGHMLGVFEKILPKYGLYVNEGSFNPKIKPSLNCLDEDYYLGTFNIVPNSSYTNKDEVSIYVQTHLNTIKDLEKGLYSYTNNALKFLSKDIILKKEVIAINQEVYERASIGISMVSTAKKSWKKFIVLGKKLQHLQMNPLYFGFMSSGYSSKSGNNLPSANKINRILEELKQPLGESYFCIGGLINNDQMNSQNMNEDIVHMKGPEEMLKEDLMNTLPHYMIPNNLIILDKLPHTPNGKLDMKAINFKADEYLKHHKRAIILPKNRTEKMIAKIWKEIMEVEELSIQDDFFEFGGNSLSAVALLNKINKAFEMTLPMQILFEYSTIEKLARKINDKKIISLSRLIPLQEKGHESPIFCWPGLGGYTLNLKPMALKMGKHQPFYGIQALGINKGEKPYSAISCMAKKDVEEILKKQPEGPYTLFGFSFGARVAFETCYQLEKLGKHVENLILIAPGSPKIWSEKETVNSHQPSFKNPAFVTILFSVFAGKINDQNLKKCLTTIKNQNDFTTFICNTFKYLSKELVTRITEIVKLTYEFKYNFKELKERKVKAPITILKARGDDYSFLEESPFFTERKPNIIHLSGDHYTILKEPYIEELITAINTSIKTNITENTTLNRLNNKTKYTMPHIDIKHFPVEIDKERKAHFIKKITQLITETFSCDEDVVSLAIQPISPSEWDALVYEKEIVAKQMWLEKYPNYGSLKSKKNHE
ncbi:amino acid adenylation domain-containing protein [Tenacibaculum sp. C7A-26P2]|uniref:amino acid adenylation domain-containing protein n=1 Tax=Tenacibaculum sp. C7A-26P2 TaxID=3447504 RepID=UPI003F838311